MTDDMLYRKCDVCDGRGQTMRKVMDAEVPGLFHYEPVPCKCGDGYVPTGVTRDEVRTLLDKTLEALHQADTLSFHSMPDDINTALYHKWEMDFDKIRTEVDTAARELLAKLADDLLDS